MDRRASDQSNRVPRRRPRGESTAAPASRLPEVYYRRRRAAALLAIAFVAILLVILMVNLGKSDDSSTVAATSSVAPTRPSMPASETEKSSEAAAASETTETVEAESGESSAEPTPQAEPELKKSCEMADLIIEASSDHPNYSATALPTFYMTIKNPTAADCVINLDENIMRFEVYDLTTNQRMWSDVDCNPSVGSGEETFPAGQERYYEAKWSRTTSAPGDCTSRQPVPGGNYFLHTVIGNNASPAYTFNMQG